MYDCVDLGIGWQYLRASLMRGNSPERDSEIGIYEDHH